MNKIITEEQAKTDRKYLILIGLLFFGAINLFVIMSLYGVPVWDSFIKAFDNPKETLAGFLVAIEIIIVIIGITIWSTLE